MKYVLVDNTHELYYCGSTRNLAETKYKKTNRKFS